MGEIFSVMKKMDSYLWHNYVFNIICDIIFLLFRSPLDPTVSSKLNKTLTGVIIVLLHAAQSLVCAKFRERSTETCYEIAWIATLPHQPSGHIYIRGHCVKSVLRSWLNYGKWGSQ